MSTDEPAIDRLEHHVGRLLVTGVMASALLLAAGLAVWLVRPDSHSAIWLLNAGLLLLMVTPIMRVLVSFGEYIHMRDWFFAATTAVVLVELTVTVYVAISRR